MAKNAFGGHWTRRKIQVFIEYLHAYLSIMKNKPFKLIYFDGFAGCGEIEPEVNESLSPLMDFGTKSSLIEGVASRVLSLQHEKHFDIYYLVELDKAKASALKETLRTKFPERNIFCADANCNDKLKELPLYIDRQAKQGILMKALAFIDPFGMTVNWDTLEACKGRGIDIWILIPTGVAVNRMLTSNGNITDAWKSKLESFLGMPWFEIQKEFYKEVPQQNLFDNIETTSLAKKENSINRIAEIYSQRLKGIWEYVSKPYVMKNSKGSILYHFVMASNNPAGLRVANDIVRKFNSIT